MYSIKEARQTLANVDLVEGLPLAEVQTRLDVGLRLGDTGKGILAFYLADLADRRGNQSSGHRSTIQLAEQRLGMDRRRAGELIAAGRKLRELPRIHGAFCAGAIGWTKVVQLVKVVVPEHEEAWLDDALRLTVAELKRKVSISREGAKPPKDGDMKGTREARYHVRATLGRVEHDLLENAMQKLGDERGEPVNTVEFIDIAARLILSTEDDGSVPGRNRVDHSLYQVVVDAPEEDEDADADLEAICCDADCDGQHVHHAVDAKTPPRMRRRVLHRDRNRCRACGNRHHLEVHHIRYRQHGGPTRMWNLLTLCNGCHSLIHGDLLRIEGKTQKRARFVDPTGVPLETVGGYASLEAVIELKAPAPRPVEAKVAPKPEPVEPAVAFAGLVGQDDVVRELGAAAKGSRLRGKPMPHVLFVGPPGTGKTTLARATAKVAGARVHETTGTHLESLGALTELVGRVGDGDMLFIDEIHAVPQPVLEAFYEAMTDRRLAGVDLPAFTVLAATTAEAALEPALLSRFGPPIQLGRYEDEALADLIQAMAEAEERPLDREAALVLAHHARGTPRTAEELLIRVLNDILGNGGEALDAVAVREALRRLGYDEDGLAPDERRYVEILRAAHRPMSIGHIARRMRLPVKTVLERVEPELLERERVRITPRGRAAVPNKRADYSARSMWRRRRVFDYAHLHLIEPPPPRRQA